MKTMKLLKFWSRKKKKKKINVIEHPSSTCHYCCQHHQFQPSAPPLPPSWLDYEQTHDTILAAGGSNALSGLASSSQAQFAPQEIAPEMNTIYSPLPVSTSSSYQQYLVPNPVYGMPVVPPPRRERSAGLFGCVVDIGVYLIRCFCPCFRIREVY